MPFTGGLAPGPMRTGGGDAGSSVPRLQRIIESIAARRGPAFSVDQETIVGAENHALARSINDDAYGVFERLKNEAHPESATVAGYLPRWERVTRSGALPGDGEPARQRKVAAVFAKTGRLNNDQGVVDVLTALLGPIFVGLTRITPANANTWWPGLAGTGASVASVSGNRVTVTGLANVPVDAPGKQFTASGGAHSGNNGTFLIQSRVSSSSVVVINNGSPVAPDTVAWSLTNVFAPWTTTLMHVLVEINPDAAPGYRNPDGTLNAAFFQKVNSINPELDLLLPADATFDWYVESSHGAIGWYLDEPNLDIEAFDS